MEIDVTKCPCYINRPLHRYDKGCLIQSHAFSEQQTVEKPILRCDEIQNCPIKEHYKQLHRYKQVVEEIKEIAETILLPMGTGKSCNRVILAKQILQKTSEVNGGEK